jgi:hypothetical protein
MKFLIMAVSRYRALELQANMISADRIIEYKKLFLLSSAVLSYLEPSFLCERPPEKKKPITMLKLLGYARPLVSSCHGSAAN